MNIITMQETHKALENNRLGAALIIEFRAARVSVYWEEGYSSSSK